MRASRTGQVKRQHGRRRAVLDLEHPLRAVWHAWPLERIAAPYRLDYEARYAVCGQRGAHFRLQLRGQRLCRRQRALGQPCAAGGCPCCWRCVRQACCCMHRANACSSSSCSGPKPSLQQAWTCMRVCTGDFQLCLNRQQVILQQPPSAADPLGRRHDITRCARSSHACMPSQAPPW